jgi:hypothetical protein
MNETQKVSRKWTAEVEREPMQDGHWYEEYAGRGQYIWKQYQRTETAEMAR